MRLALLTAVAVLLAGLTLTAPACRTMPAGWKTCSVGGW